MMLKLKLQYFVHLMRRVTHWKRLWCWEGLGAGGEGDDRGWDGWMASLTRWTWVWVNSGSWWWTGRPGVLWFMGSQRIGHDWATELNWTVFSYLYFIIYGHYAWNRNPFLLLIFCFLKLMDINESLWHWLYMHYEYNKSSLERTPVSHSTNIYCACTMC